MSQSWTDDVYASGHVGETDLQNMENNFAALKSTFSGATAPSNPVAGMFWYATTAHILRQRNEANNAWLNIYDLANSRVLNSERVGNVLLSGLVQTSRQIIAGTGLSGGGTLAANRTLNHEAHTGDVTGSTALTIGSAKIGQAKLKTTIHEQSTNQLAWIRKTLTYADYGFQCKIKSTGSAGEVFARSDQTHPSEAQPTYAGEQVYIKKASAGTLGYVKYAYITASGELFWIWILRDKTTKEIISVDMASDHCAFGLDDLAKRPHPFEYEYDPTKHEIVLINPTNDELKGMYAKKTDSLIEVFLNNYEIDELSSPKWPAKPVTVKIKNDDWFESWIREKPVETEKRVIPKCSYVLCKKLKIKK